jgi:hypothetical protein
MASQVNLAGENYSTHNPAMNRRAREKAESLTCVEALAVQFALQPTAASLAQAESFFIFHIAFFICH